MKRAAREDSPEEDELDAVPTECAMLVARLYDAWREGGRARAGFVVLFNNAGYNLPPATLGRWTQGVEAHGVALSGGAKRGRKDLLSEAEKRVLCGYVVDRLEHSAANHPLKADVRQPLEHVL